MLSWTVSWIQKEAEEKVTQGATARYLEPLRRHMRPVGDGPSPWGKCLSGMYQTTGIDPLGERCDLDAFNFEAYRYVCAC
jgi:hypothetical protein